jgi:uncharacterized protein YuzE
MGEIDVERLAEALSKWWFWRMSARMTWDAQAGAIYIYAIEGYDGPVTTTELFKDKFSVNVDRTPEGRLVGLEVYGIDRLDDAAEWVEAVETAKHSEAESA